MRIPSRMRAVVLAGPDAIEVREVETPAPGPADVLIRVEACALCSTDVALIRKPLPGQPPYGEFVVGHEYAGTVAALGETVDEFQVGDRVTVEAHLGCQRCRNCRLGDYTACLNYGNRRKGHRANGFTTNGGNAEFVVNHVNTVYGIPDSVSFDEASLATNVGCVLYGYETLGGYLVGDTVAVVGPGPLGLCSAIVARALGAGKVILVGTRASRLAVAGSLPIDRIVDSGKEDPLAAIREETRGRGADVVVESSGSEGGLRLAIQGTRRMGKILLLGFSHEPLPADFEALALDNKAIYTVRGEGRANVGRAVSLLERGLVDLKPIITHRFPLARIEEAFATFTQRTGGAIKVVSRPQE